MILLLIDYILLMRVLALYHQGKSTPDTTNTMGTYHSIDKKLAACLRAGDPGVAALHFTLGIFIYGKLREEIVVGRLADAVTICGVDGNLPNMWGAISWTVPMVWAITLMVLALCKAAEFWRISAGFKDFSLVKVLMQDQAVHFILVIFCSIINIISDQLQISNDFLAGIIGISGSPSFLCVVGSRLLVHLKEAGERGLNGGTSYRMGTITSIEFS
ncbi:hypothetical protein DFH11DRAFT_1611591 [Phellopilus nigrolimitatus]|nr:hypothetical protein DFH11DRAFT_1611591 [Phellopilus nigrolimitatus]